MNDQSFRKGLLNAPWCESDYGLKSLSKTIVCLHLLLVLILLWLVNASSLTSEERLQMIYVIAVATLTVASVTLYVLHRFLKSNSPSRTSRHSAQPLAQPMPLNNNRLVNLQNHQTIEQILSTDLARAERSGKPLTLAMLEVDWLEDINDSLGFEVGDTCLQHLIQEIGNGTRKGDWLARFSNGEFALLLWDINASGARAVYQRLTARLAEQPFALDPQDTSKLHISVSIGACEYRPGMIPETILRQAHKELYRAKAQGGGVSIARFSDEPPSREAGHQQP